MRKTNRHEAQMLTDTVQSGGGLVLGGCVGPREGAWGALRLPGVLAGPIAAHYKMNVEPYFCFLLFFLKVKILFGFLLVNENRY